MIKKFYFLKIVKINFRRTKCEHLMPHGHTYWGPNVLERNILTGTKWQGPNVLEPWREKVKEGKVKLLYGT